LTQVIDAGDWHMPKLLSSAKNVVFRQNCCLPPKMLSSAEKKKKN
jgi:hypothetical protein